MIRRATRRITQGIALCILCSFAAGIAAAQDTDARLISVLAGSPSVAAFSDGVEEYRAVPDRETFETLLRNLFDTEFSALNVRVLTDRRLVASEHETVVSVLVRYRLAGQSLTIVLALVDEQTGEGLGGGVYTGFADLGLVRIVRQAVSDGRRQLEDIVDTSPALRTIPETLVELSLTSPHTRGTLRFQENRDPVFRTDIPFEIGTEITLLHRAPGFYPRTETLRIDAPVMRFEAPELEPVIQRELVYSWTTNRPLGAGAGLRVYPLPRSLFLELGAHTSSAYRFRSGSQFTANFDLRLNAGGYLYRADSRRFALSVAPGAGVILTTLPTAAGASTFADPYVVIASIAAEIPYPRLAPFARLDVLSYAGGNGGFFTPGVYTYLSLGVRQAWTD
ncbi:MAG: hypothetical protein EA383_17185 [Spirochaetaceae bacterium]|nr:MAG: hypothetical protein EA383_17185 [Spirochaetaceae bacterium]